MSGMATYTPGMEISGGSLGQGLPIAVGMALGLRAQGQPGLRLQLHVRRRTRRGLDLGGGDVGAPLAARQPDRLVDVNNQQADGPSTKVLGFEPLADKWAAFGWHVQRVDGNDLAAVLAAFDTARDAGASRSRA